MLRRFIFLFAVIAADLAPLQAEELGLAVAANFTLPMKEIAGRFEAQSGHRLNISFGSSGRLYAQISNGAPFQLFFSADQEKPEALVAGGLALADSRFTYAVGGLVLWSPDERAHVADAEVLMNQSADRLAIANPRLAPYGIAAMQVLEALGLESAYRDRLVMGENINQAYQFVDTGNVPVGLLALSQVMAGGELRKGVGWIIPGELYDPIRQDAVMMKAARDSVAAREFMKFMLGNEARTIMADYGYGTE